MEAPQCHKDGGMFNETLVKFQLGINFNENTEIIREVTEPEAQISNRRLVLFVNTNHKYISL